MKKAALFVLVIFLLSSPCSWGQMNTAEAKAAYLLAEEAFGSNDWKAVLKYLDQSKTKLGGTNAKILYLQVLAEIELAKKDLVYYDAAKNTIADFENAPDVKDFSEDKVLEIMKIKLKIDDWKARAQEALVNEQLGAQKFRDFSFPEWPLKMSLKELKTLDKKQKRGFFAIINFYTNKQLKVDLYGKPLYDDEYSPSIRRIYLKNDTTIGYRKIIAYRGGQVKASTHSSENDIKDFYKQMRDSLSHQFGFAPEKRAPVEKFENTTAGQEEYYWSKNGKTVSLYYFSNEMYKSWLQAVFLEVMIEPVY